MAQTERRTLEIVASVKDFASNTLGKIGKGFAAMGKGAMSALGGLARAITSVRGVLVGFLGVLAVRGTKGLIDWQAELHRTAKTIGTTTEALSTLGFAFDQAGVGAGRSLEAVRELLKNAGEAILRPGEKRDIFAALGLSEADLRRADPVQLFEQIASGLRNFRSEAEKLSVLEKVFGGVGRELLPLFEEGPEGLRKLADEAQRLGLVLSSEAGKKAEDFRKTWSLLGMQVEAVLRDVLIALLPTIQKHLEAFSRWVADNRDSITRFFEGLAKVIGAAASALSGLLSAASKVASAVGIPQTQEDVVRRMLQRQMMASGEWARMSPESRWDALHSRTRSHMDWLQGGSAFGGGSASSAGAPVTVSATRIAGPDFGSGDTSTRRGAPDWWKQFTEQSDLWKGVREGIGSMVEAWNRFREAGVNAAQAILSGGMTSLGDELTDIVTGAAKAKDALRDWAKSVLHDLIRIINHLIVMRALGFILGGFSAGSSASAASANGFTEVGASGGGLGGYGFERGGTVNRTLLGVGRGGSWRKFEHGGVAYGPTMALFGEGSASSGEAFVPLRGGRIPVQIAGGTFGGGMNVNVNIQTIDSKSFEDRLAQHPGAISRAVDRELKRNPNLRSSVRMATR